MKKLHSGLVCFQAGLCHQVQRWLSHRSLSTHYIDKDHTCGDKTETCPKYALIDFLKNNYPAQIGIKQKLIMTKTFMIISINTKY